MLALVGIETLASKILLGTQDQLDNAVPKFELHDNVPVRQLDHGNWQMEVTMAPRFSTVG